jgi:hypothetical protein
VRPHIYHLIDQSRRFERVEPGVYRLLPPTTEHARPQNGHALLPEPASPPRSEATPQTPEGQAPLAQESPSGPVLVGEF